MSAGKGVGSAVASPEAKHILRLATPGQGMDKSCSSAWLVRAPHLCRVVFATLNKLPALPALRMGLIHPAPSRAIRSVDDVDSVGSLGMELGYSRLESTFAVMRACQVHILLLGNAVTSKAGAVERTRKEKKPPQYFARSPPLAFRPLLSLSVRI